MAYAIRSGAGYMVASSFSTSLAKSIAQADQDTDNIGKHPEENPLVRPGPDPRGGKTNPTAHHWYTTPQAEVALKCATTTEEFGVAMHAYQDSYSHWQKGDKPKKAGEIWDAHANNDILIPGVKIGLTNPHALFDTYDPVMNPVQNSWATIDANMTAGTNTYLQPFIEKQWETWYGK